MWKYYDGRVRSLIELLYGSNARAEMSKERESSIQTCGVPRRDSLA